MSDVIESIGLALNGGLAVDPLQNTRVVPVWLLNESKAEIDRLRTENERLREALEEIKRLNEMSGFNGCAIAEVYSKHLPDPPTELEE